ncbi:MAG TPA: T9SS type A sorting domain-containing protein, partial [Candidatus Cloacimonetes bacterium]|nr:T9SS type A sorting domain-containing protein [Candidatus Cloacimonadota bacterium]
FNVNSGLLSLGDIPSGSSLIMTIDISLVENAPLQHEGIINLDFYTSTNYTQQCSLGLFVSQIPVSLNEDFSVFPPLAWNIVSTSGNTGGWSFSNSNIAGGTAPEIVALLFPLEYYDDYLITPVINTLGSTTLELMFKHSLLINLRNFDVSIETTSDGLHWNEVWTHIGTTIPPQTESLLIESPDVGSASFQLAFRVCGNTQQYMLDGWIIDDFSLNSIEIEPHGYIAGNVSLTSGNGDLRDVEITAGNVTKNPDENGNYVLTVNQGIYDVTAFLPGYIASTVNGINVQNWQTIGVDFVLDELTTYYCPQNLSAQISSNDITLSWDIPGSENLRNNRRNISRNERDFVSYKIYRNGELIAQPSPIDNTEYFDPNLNSGTYSYYVTALYSDGESVPSNTIEVEITLAPPSNVSFQITAPMMVLLLWNPPEETNRNFSHYRVYRDSDLIADNILQTYYFDNYVSMGLHVYGISAVYGNYESDPVILMVNMTDAENNLIPSITVLKGNSPNPFNPDTKINFSLNQEAFTSIEIYNLKGEKVRNLVNGILPAANHSILWNGKDDRGRSVSSGIYFYRMKTADYSAVKKMIMLK